jgi:RND superfamily putative drug exporter
MFRALARFTFQYRWAVLASGVVFLVVAGILGASLFKSLSSGGYANPRSESAQVSRTLTEEFGGGDAALVLLLSARDGRSVTDPAIEQAARSQIAAVARQPGVLSVQSYYDTGASQLISADKKETYALVQLVADEEQPARVRALRALPKSDLVEMKLGGAPAVNADVLEQVARDLELAEGVTLPVVAVLLVVVVGPLVAAALPLAIGGVAILGAFLILRLLVVVTPVSVFAVNVVTMLGLGLAIDYSLFIVSRFREELAHGNEVEEALVRTLQTAGHTVLFSGLTVTIGLLSLLLFPQMVLYSMGLGGSAGVVVAVAASLTLLPALLAVLGRRVNALSVRRLQHRRAAPERSEQEGFWFRLSHFVMRHPVLVLLVTLTPLVCAGLPFLHVRFTMPDERNIPRGLESRTVAERMAQHFSANELAPIHVLLRLDGPPLDPGRLAALYAYVLQLRDIPGVKRVDSVVSLDPRLDARGLPGYLDFYESVQSGLVPEGQVAVTRFTHGNDTLLEVYYEGNPHELAARDLIRRIRGLEPPMGARVQVGGQTAELVDLLHDLGRQVPFAFGIIVGVIFILLFLMLGSLVVPFKAVLLNVLSLTVSFGALVWMFQDGHGGRWLGYEALGGIDALQPVLIFVIAFGLSMDYEVFLLSRIKESFDQTGDNTSSVALGVQRTGGIITSAAALLGVVILGFAAGKVLSVKQVGVGLFLAVLVDATLVRSLLVPATMRLLGHLNWWAPRPLRALHGKLGLGDPEEPPSGNAAAGGGRRTQA